MCVISTFRRNFELLIHLQSRVESVRSLRRRHFWCLLDGGLARKAVGQWLCGLSWGGSTCKGAVVWRSPCWDLSWLPGFNADESSRSSEVRRRAGGEWHELPRFWGENKYLASLRGVGHVAQEFDCPSVRYLGISIHYFERKKKNISLDFSGFGYGLWGVGCLHITRTFEFSVNPVEHNMGKYDKWEDSVPLTLGASSRTGVPSAR